MLGALQAILCVLRNLLLAILWGGAEVINGLVLALAGTGTAAAYLLPDMPAAPAPPDSGVLQFIAWLYPLGALLGVFLVFINLWVAVITVKAILRWIKLL
jgi:hypothetical protein